MLQIKLGDINRFPFLDPPSEGQVNAAFALLRELNAVEKSRRMTKIGKKMSELPVGRSLFPNVDQRQSNWILNEILTIVSGLSIRDPRRAP